MKHTPAPWGIAKPDSGAISIYGRDGQSVATITVGPRQRKDDAAMARKLADARLIAAAPDLLAVAKDILAFLESRGYDATLVKAAIAKAEGATEEAEK